MKTVTKKSKDGSKEFVFFYPEAGDRFVSRFKKVGTNNHPAIVNGKAVIIESHFLGVTGNDGKEYTIVVSNGQKKVLDKTEDIQGKIVVFEKYKHKQYGELLGARIEKEIK